MQMWRSRFKHMLSFERSRRWVPAKVARRYRSKKSDAAGKQTRTERWPSMEWRLVPIRFQPILCVASGSFGKVSDDLCCDRVLHQV
jgi:hypothetical protein